MVTAGDAPSAKDCRHDADDVVVMEIEDSIDLHTFAPRDIPDVVDSYLEAAAEAGFQEVRVIHGRGTGFQRNRVWQVLEGHPLVTAFRNAPATRGGWGATLVELRVGAAPGRGPRQ
jgi:dsDNA-specific endonuclease/ATPase MutS2